MVALEVEKEQELKLGAEEKLKGPCLVLVIE